jgi:long-chain acyl-CoA synthetase
MSEPTFGTPEHWARATPDAPAVVDARATLTYAEWDDRANRLASSLVELGIGPGSRVAVRSRSRHEWFVINRAIGKLQAEQVAVNWRLTPPEARYIVDDSGATAVFYDDSDPDVLAAEWSDLTLVSFGAQSSTALSYEELVESGKPEERQSPLTVPLVIYTSGTTGKPKGVLGADRVRSAPEKLAEYMRSVGSAPGTPLGSRSLLTMPLHHGAGPGVAFGALFGGGTVYALDPFDAEVALQLIDRHRITTWTSVPTMLLRIKSLDPDVLASYDVSSITTLTCGAAPVPQSLKEWVIGHFGNVLWEGYGATEVGMLTFMRPEDQLTKPGSSGRPFDNVEIRIVSDDWSELDVGETGEIAVRTPMVIGRYLGREPLGPDTLSEEGFFRTGDVGRVDGDGYLFITDRKKDMIVAGGVNIYPAEIEAVLIEHPDVIDAAVIGIPHDDFGEQPLAFVELRDGASVTPPEIVAFTESKLAAYKRPRRVEFVDALPRNPTGKVLKTELRAPYWEGRERKV